VPPRLSHIVRNAGKPGYLGTMVKKVLVRGEPDTRAAATTWARERAQPLDEWCSSVDEDLWKRVLAQSEVMTADAHERVRATGEDLGGGGAHPLLSFLVLSRRPEVVIETGVAAGWSSRAVLEALNENGRGRLYSSDFPYFRLEDPERFIGVVVPACLRDRWHLDVRGDRRALPDILRSVGRVDLFHYDSDKSVSGRRFALDAVWPRLAPDAVMLMDDIQDNMFFAEWVTRRNLPHLVFGFEGKYVGAVGLD
jgi:predicted O-methyltransferase YrrM